MSSMDPRTRVAEALACVVQREGMWPTGDLARLRNQVLDESGGDLRPLVAFVMQLAELGVPDAITASRVGDSATWLRTRRRLALSLTTERFFLPEMARWGVDCWGMALGAPGAALVPTAPPLPRGQPPSGPSRPGSAPPRYGVARATAASGGTARAAAGARPSPARLTTMPAAPQAHLPGWVKPGKVPPVARWIAGSHLPRPAPAPAINTPFVERYALPLLAALALLALAVMSRMPGIPTTAAVDPIGRRSATVPDTISAVAVPLVPATPPDESTAASSPAPARAAGPLVAGSRPAPAFGPAVRAHGAALEGAFQLTTRRSFVRGESRCATIANRVQWNPRTVEQIVVSDDGRRFTVLTRPGVAGIIDPSGAFQSEVVRGERAGTTSSFRLHGATTAGGFRAVGETRTRTLLKWRDTLDCLFIAEFDGERLVGGSPSVAHP